MFAILDHLIDSCFAVLLLYLVIRFTKPYTSDQHRDFMLLVCENKQALNNAISYGQRMAAAERMWRVCREDADRTMIHLLAQVGSESVAVTSH